MDTELLSVFRQVAREGSFTAAAKTLGYTQSAVSRQVAVLEAELGAALFDRLPRGIRLTESGRCLLPHAEALTGRLALAREDLRALRELRAGRLRVGAFPTAGAALVPAAVAAFRVSCPEVSLTLVEGLVRDLVVQLAAGDLDVAIVASAADGLLDGFTLRHIMDDRMFVAMHPSHRYAGRAQVRLADLAGDDWIAGRDRPEQTLLASASATVQPKIAYVIGEWVAKQGFVAAGLGITLIPSLAVSSVRPDIALVPLHPDDLPVRVIYAATPAGITPPPALEPFLDEVDACLSALSDR
jgi:DNA-binding transcriptional LysR family regulator